MAPQARNRVSRGWALVRLRAKANSEVQPTSGNRAPSAAALTMLGGTKPVSQSRNGGTSTAAPGSGLRRTASPEGSGPQAASRGGMIAAANSAALHIQAVRSEEHTSELQSRLHLVCRLLLEKKKKQIQEYQYKTSSND